MNLDTAISDKRLKQGRMSIGYLCVILIRSLIWIALLLVVPLSIIPVFRRIYEEFGLELPAVTRMTLMLGEFDFLYRILYVLVVTQLIIVWQLLLFFSRGKPIGFKLLLVDWTLAAFVTAFLVIALGMPMISILTGLDA